MAASSAASALVETIYIALRPLINQSDGFGGVLGGFPAFFAASFAFSRSAFSLQNGPFDTHWGHCCMLWQVIVSMIVLVFLSRFSTSIYASLPGTIVRVRVKGCHGFQLVGPNL